MISTEHNRVELLSVVIPAFNEYDNIETVFSRLVPVRDQLLEGGTNIEIVLISDGSTDRTFERARELLMTLGLQGSLVEFTKNYGAYQAIRCGLRESHGDAIAIISADGQDPPETLPAMCDEIARGSYVVWGRRNRRRNDSLLKRLSSRLFYLSFKLLTRFDLPPNGLDFVIFRRTVRDQILEYRERNNPFFVSLYNLGFPTTSIPYTRGIRISGKSKWTLRKKFRLAIDTVTGSSMSLLRLVVILGSTIGLVGIAFGGVTLVRAMLGSTGQVGWASLMVTTSVIGGLLLIGLGIVGEYLWRVLDEVRARPQFVVRDRWSNSID